jgi:ribonucleoside-diphosphate reductase, adenosylcobalamin-dependent
MEDFQLTALGQIVWEDRYGLKDENGNLLEKNILETFRRVAKAIASKEKDPKLWEERFYDIMANKYFCPAGRILAHAGTHYSQLLNCFVLPFEDDSLEAIMDTAKKMAVIQKFGGGTGMSYSTLRPAGSYIKGVNGRSCGVLGFLNMMSVTSEVIEQGGCFTGDTYIATPTGAKQIKDLKENDLVYTMSEKGFILQPCSSSWITNQNAEIWKITIDTGLDFYATRNHPFMPKDFNFSKKNYIKAEDLKIGSPLKSFIQDNINLKSMKFSHNGPVYNVEVKETHNFVVCNSLMTMGVVVSNSRRGANLGLLEVSHPDIWEYISYKTEHNWDHLREFIDVKDEEKWTAFKFENLYKLQMYNISIGITDEFLEAVKKDAYWPLMWKNKEWELYSVTFTKDSSTNCINFDVTADSEKTALWKTKKKVPYPGAKDEFEITGKRKIKASEIWNKMCYNAWADGCPGLINLSTARKFHNLEYVNPILSTNPCGEQPLGPYGSCNLSSMPLFSFYNEKTNKINYPNLQKVIHTAVRFADNVIDNCEFPISEIKKVAKQERRIGLGTMGVHDLLIKMKLEYDSKEGRAIVAFLLEFIRDEAYRASIEIAKEKGPFPLFDKEKYCKGAFIKTLPEDIQNDIHTYGIRNSCLLSQAPVGTTGTMYNCSTGCEPWFALSFQRNTRLGSYEDGCPDFIQWKKENPDKPKPSYFKTAQEIAPEDHIKMMTLFSKYICSAVSKTINLPSSATVEDVKKAFTFAMEQGAKGITIFRDGSKEGVLVNKDKKVEEKKIIEETRKQVYELQETKEEKIDDTRVLPKQRGSRAPGATYRIPMQQHNLYVTVNRNKEGDLVEVFAIVGKSKKAKDLKPSGVENSWAEALGRLASLCLRAGVDTQSVISNLKNITSDKPIFTTIGDNDNSELIPSPPHAIARVIEEESKYSFNIIQKPQEFKVEGHFCAECGSSNLKIKSPTCYDCLSCGYSGCGS